MGDNPTLMLNAPVPSTRKILDRAGVSIDDIDLFEVTEAFAIVSEKYMRDLDRDHEWSTSMAAPWPWVTPSSGHGAPSSSARSSTSSSGATSRSSS